jgi:deoxyadenosine/deoxycytidine kinase
MDPIIISIDGPIGSGKSTTLNELRKLGYKCFTQNLEEWDPYLKLFYENPTRWAFTLELKVLHFMYEQYLRIKTIKTNEIVFVECAPFAPLIFTTLQRRLNYMTELEYNLFKSIFESLNWKSDLNIILTADICTLRERVAKRHDAFSIPESYLISLQSEYENINRLGKYETINTDQNLRDTIYNILRVVKTKFV